ncbi:MAG: ATP-binding cassette domain-containing protein [Devosia sp.]|nr:ATP-binding cassette domain-containing protein [Devosia sp.]
MPQEPTLPLLEAIELTVDFGAERALGTVGFAVEAGERLAVVGESGAGKSMLGLSLAGLLPPGALPGGAWRFEDRPLPSGAALAALRGRRLGFVLQHAEAAFDPLQPVGAQLRAAAGRCRDAVSAADIDQMLTELGIAPPRLTGYPDQFRPDERQLLAVAAALLPRPDVLVADEPCAWLDPIARRRLLGLIATLSDRRKMAVILLTRDPREAALLCQSVMVLRQGRIVDGGRTDAVLGKPRDEYVRALVAAGRPRARALMRSPLGAHLLDVHRITRAPRRPGLAGLTGRGPAILKEVSFTLKAAECVAIVGPAGAGKSTLARIIAGLERPDEGEMVFERLTYRGGRIPPALRLEIGYVTGQGPTAFDPRYTVLAAIAEPLRLLPMMDGEARARRVLAAMDLVGLGQDLARLSVTRLPAPDALRVALARALATRPRLLLIDEPVAALDVRPRGEMLALIARLRADFGLTLLFFTRDFEAVRGLADRVFILDGGEIVESGRPADLQQAPRHRTTQALLQARLPELM